MSAQLTLQIQEPKKKTEWEHIFDVMHDTGEWTLMQLQKSLAQQNYWYSETSISARLRELARGKQPGWTVTKRTDNGRTYFYRVVRI